MGNSLRRILLSSLEGSAVTHARIAGADHEFCSLPGVLEDVTDIILNIKAIIVDVDSDTPKRMRLERKEKGEIRAGDFECDPGVVVYNDDLLIATLTDKVPFSVELTVARGRGYVPAIEHVDETQELGVMLARAGRFEEAHALLVEAREEYERAGDEGETFQRPVHGFRA